MERYKIIFIFTVTFLIMSIYSVLRAEEKLRIVVLNFDAKNTYTGYGELVREKLEASLYKTDQFDILERNEMQIILKEQGLQMSGCVEDSCFVELGKILSADIAAYGSIIKLKKYNITLKIVDVKKSRILFIDTSTAGSEEEIQTEVETLANKMAFKLTGRQIKKAGDSSTRQRRSMQKTITPVGYYLRGIVPGIAQTYAGYEVKGPIFLGSFLITGIAAIFTYNNFKEKKESYNELLKGETKEIYDKKYDDYKVASNIAIGTSGILALFYLVHWFDMIFITKPDYQKEIGAVNSGKNFFSLCHKRNMSLGVDERFVLSFGLKF